MRQLAENNRFFGTLGAIGRLRYALYTVALGAGCGFAIGIGAAFTDYEETWVMGSIVTVAAFGMLIYGSFGLTLRRIKDIRGKTDFAIPLTLGIFFLKAIPFLNILFFVFMIVWPGQLALRQNMVPAPMPETPLNDANENSSEPPKAA